MKDKQIDIAQVIENLFFCEPDEQGTPSDYWYHPARATKFQTLANNLAEMIDRALPVELLGIFLIDERDGTLSEALNREKCVSTQLTQLIAKHLVSLGVAGRDRAFTVPASFNLPIAVIVPLKITSRLIGLIALGPKRSGNPFEKDDLDYLTTMAELTVVAFENTRLSKDFHELNTTLEEKVSARTQHLMELNKQLTEQYSQLQTLDELKESLTRMVVHDLKNPLGTILLGLEFIECNQTDQLPELVKNTLNIMTATAQEMQDLIANLLDVNRMEAGFLQLNKEPTKVDDIISEGLKRVQVLAQSRKVRFVKDCPADMNGFFDRGLMTRVIVNLLVNAVKFAKRGTEIHIGVHSEGGGGFRLMVTNHGHSIPPEALPRIFEKFFQVESKNMGLASGNGLGLTFCKMVTEEHGGHIEVASPAPGWDDGARFTLILPGGP